MNSFAGGGAERVCLNLAKQLYQLGIESVFVTIYSKADYKIPGYIQIFSLGINERDSVIIKILEIIKGIFGVNRLISENGYVLITAHLPMSHLLASLTKVRKKCLYIMHVTQHLVDVHNSWCYKMGFKLFFWRKKIITVSKGLKTELINDYRISPDKITTIYNPCCMSPLKSDRVFQRPHMRQYILVMGRLEGQKNPLLALELYYRGRFYNEYDLIYLGKGSLEGDLRNRISEYGLHNHVFLLGFQKNTEHWIKNASLLLSTSRQEGLPMNLIEALSDGVPVVSTDCPYGPNEILTDELSKYLIYPEKNFDESISIILSALRTYPEITKKYYENFEGKLIAEAYLSVWKKYFGKEMA